MSRTFKDDAPTPISGVSSSAAHGTIHGSKLVRLHDNSSVISLEKIRGPSEHAVLTAMRTLTNESRRSNLAPRRLLGLGDGTCEVGDGIR